MIRTTIAVECDSCGRRHHFRVPTGGRLAEVVRRARRLLAERGWSGGDLCPTCREDAG